MLAMTRPHQPHPAQLGALPCQVRLSLDSRPPVALPVGKDETSSRLIIWLRLLGLPCLALCVFTCMWVHSVWVTSPFLAWRKFRSKLKH